MRILFVSLALAVASVPSLASAAFGIESVTGMNVIDNSDDHITDFTEGALEDPVNNLAFLVYEGAQTTDGFHVDHNGAAGTYSQFSQLTSNDLAPGEYGSYLVHFDPAGQPPRHVRASGSVQFDRFTRIVGLAIFPGADIGLGSTPDTLGITDAIYGPNNTYYTSFAFRGLELGNSSSPDGFSISSDGRTFSFDTGTLGLNATGIGIDEVRLILTAVPEASSIIAWSMIAVMGIAVWYVRARRTNRDLAIAES